MAGGGRSPCPEARQEGPGVRGWIENPYILYFHMINSVCACFLHSLPESKYEFNETACIRSQAPMAGPRNVSKWTVRGADPVHRNSPPTLNLKTLMMAK